MKHKVVFLIVVTGLLQCCIFNTNDPLSASGSAHLEKLMEGNLHFTNSPHKHDIVKLKKGQTPFAVVVSCSDSRVPPELIFNQGLGDLFVVRTAGNIIGEFELGSIEYAVTQLHTPMIIVLGHENCGAVCAYYEHKHDSLPGSMQSIVNYFKHEKELKSIKDTTRNCIPQLVKGNVLHAVHLIGDDPLLAKKIKTHQLEVVGAVYHMHDGTVELLDDVVSN